MKWINCLKGLGMLSAYFIAKHFFDSYEPGVMIAMATAYINQERFGVQFEDRINALINIDPDETPCLSMIKKSEGYNQRVDFQSHTLASSNASNSGVDGADVTN